MSKKRLTFLSKLLITLLIMFSIIVTGAGLGYLTASIQTMPTLDKDIHPAVASQIYDIHGNLLATVHATENRTIVPLAKIPQALQDAFIASEDHDFYNHSGISPKGIMRAVWVNITGSGVVEGGSTITQQLARNALLSHERTFKRKIQEAALALQIERRYTKREILELYLNQIYFGEGAYGVQAAAQTYFGKNSENLTLAECAMLAGIPRSPNYYSPLNNLNAAKAVQATVLDQMVKYSFIAPTEAQTAKDAKIVLKQALTKNTAIAPYFVNYVTQILIDRFGADAVYKDGLKVYTTLDSNMQQAAEQAMQNLSTHFTDSNGLKQPQGALVAIDPKNGHIRAMVGGRGGDQFNRAILAERQPGSAFKPFVYLAAMDSGLTPLTTIEDTPITYGNWTPNNYDGVPHGKVTLRRALASSYNISAVKLLQQVGVEKAIQYAQALGISTLVNNGTYNDHGLSLALGGLTRGVTPLEMASAYGVLANQGIRAEPMAIVKIVDRHGNIIEQYTPKAKTVVSEKAVTMLVDMMRGVVEWGTGTAANIGRPAAGKTGTTNDYRDAWFVGFTPDLATAVWMGDDHNSPMNGVSGGAAPAVIWRSFMVKALKDYPARDFSRAAGVPYYIGYDPEIKDDKKGKICKDTGKLATPDCPVTVDPEATKPLPTETCTLHVNTKPVTGPVTPQAPVGGQQPKTPDTPTKPGEPVVPVSPSGPLPSKPDTPTTQTLKKP